MDCDASCNPPSDPHTELLQAIHQSLILPRMSLPIPWPNQRPSWVWRRIAAGFFYRALSTLRCNPSDSQLIVPKLPTLFLYRLDELCNGLGPFEKLMPWSLSHSMPSLPILRRSSVTRSVLSQFMISYTISTNGIPPCLSIH